MANATHFRPKTVVIVAGFLFAATVIAVVVAISLLFPNPVLDRLWRLNPAAAPAFHAFGRISGVLLLALGVATLTTARGLLRGQRWAWWFAMVLFVVNGCGDVVALIATGDKLRGLSGVMIAVIFLYLLARSPVRNYFQSSS